MYRDHLEQALQPLVDRLWNLEPRNGWDYNSLVDCLTWEDVVQVTRDADDDLIINDAMTELPTSHYLEVIAAGDAHGRLHREAIRSLAGVLLPLILDRCEHEESERQRELPEAAQLRIRAWGEP